MNKTACILNSTELGGAERSFITQLSLSNEGDDYVIFYPSVEGRSLSLESKTFLEQKGLMPGTSFPFHSELYSTSRSSRFENVIEIIIGMLEQILLFKTSNLLSYKNIWCNGTKVFFPIFFSSIIFGYRGTLVWHLRDYPSGGVYEKVIKFFYRRFSRFKLILVGNSDSVAESYKEIFNQETVLRVYNPVEELKTSEENRSFNGVLGFAGMSAPWKGVHELYLWASLYEDELINLGVKEIAVFGKNIYLTKGAHSKYSEDLALLKKKFPSKLIKEKGLVEPDKIYASIDVMLHLSNRVEPFGRVILESFAHGIPCISTGLGGAGELMAGSSGLIHFSHDYGGLFEMVKKLISDEQFRLKNIVNGHKKYEEFQAMAKSDLNSLKSSYLQ